MRITCPQCRATLDAGVYRSTGTTHCPFCNGPLPLHELTEAPDWVEAEAEQESGEGEGIESGDAVASARRELVLRDPPTGSGIEVVQSGPERLVLVIPPGRKGTTSLGCFALFWNGFMTVFTTVMLGAMIGDGHGGLPVLGLLAFLSLFWAVGLGMLYFWVRLRFTTFLALLEPGRFVLQRTLFGKKRIEEASLGAGSRAELVESYKENDRPVHCVAVHGTDRTIKFGTALTAAEKDWLRDALNQRLGHVAPPPAANPVEKLTDLLALSRETVAPIAPEDLGGSTEVTIVERSPDRLILSMPLFGQGCLRTAIVLILGVFAFVWCSAIFVAMVLPLLNPNRPNQHPIEFIIPVCALLPVLAPLFILLFVTRGKMVLTVTPESLTCRRQWGPLGWKQTLRTPQISSVSLTSFGGAQRRGETVGDESAQAGLSATTCVVRAGTEQVYVTSWRGSNTPRLVGGLLRHQLERWGIGLADE